MDSSTDGLTTLRDAARTTQKVEVSQVQNPLTRKALEKWNDLRGERRFPSRKDAAPRELSALLRNIALIRVVQGGADFEFRVLGDAIVQSQMGLEIGMTTSELDDRYPGYGALLRVLYQRICDARAPQAYRGFFERAADRRSFYHESLLLPLGADDGVVDHILVVGVFAMDAEKALA
jgi:hypothetical protein